MACSFASSPFSKQHVTVTFALHSMMLTVVGWACDFGQWMHSPVQSGFGPKAGKPTDRTNGAKLRLRLLQAIKGRRPMAPIATLATSGRVARRAGMYLLAASVPCAVHCFSCSSFKLARPKRIAEQPEQLQDRLNPESRNSKRLHFLFLFLSSTHHFH